MTTLTLRDPLMKTTIKDRLYALLYVPTDTKMFERLQTIIMKNAVMVKAVHASFMYKAVNYSCDVVSVLPRPRNQLDPRLEPQMQEYLADVADLAKEKPLILAYLTHVLNTSDHPEDWLKLLVPVLHSPIQNFITEHGLNPCRFKHMSDEDAAEFLEKNSAAVKLVKQRLVTNLLTT